MSKMNNLERPARTAIEAYLVRLHRGLGALDRAQVAAVAAHLWQVAQNGGQILVAGNGGSAATASHMAVDLGKTVLGRPAPSGGRRIRVISLADAIPVLTAWANDEGYNTVYAEQVATLAGPGDAVVLLSVSGNSPNIVAAAGAARARGATVIALLGLDGGAVRPLADLAIVVPSDDYGVVEDIHLMINHAITSYLADVIARSDGKNRGTPV